MLARAVALSVAFAVCGTAEAAVVIAHRGHAGAKYENTLHSIAYAEKNGATWVETDVRVTASGRSFVTIHDRRFERTTNCSGNVARRTLDYIRRRCRTASGPVPSLAAYLDEVAHTPLHVLLELKPPMTERQVRAVIARVRTREMAPRTVIQSFRPDLVAIAAAAAPDIPVWILARRADAASISAAVAAGASGISLRYTAVFDASVPLAYREEGLTIAAWVANDEPTWDVLLALGVDAIITDRPRELALEIAGL